MDRVIKLPADTEIVQRGKGRPKREEPVSEQELKERRKEYNRKYRETNKERIKEIQKRSIENAPVLQCPECEYRTKYTGHMRRHISSCLNK